MIIKYKIMLPIELYLNPNIFIIAPPKIAITEIIAIIIIATNPYPNIGSIIFLSFSFI